jgi:hypothetical protein
MEVGDFTVDNVAQVISKGSETNTGGYCTVQVPIRIHACMSCLYCGACTLQCLILNQVNVNGKQQLAKVKTAKIHDLEVEGFEKMRY